MNLYFKHSLNFSLKDGPKFANFFKSFLAAEFLRHTLIPIIKTGRELTFLIPTRSKTIPCFSMRELPGTFEILVMRRLIVVLNLISYPRFLVPGVSSLRFCTIGIPYCP